MRVPCAVLVFSACFVATAAENLTCYLCTSPDSCTSPAITPECLGYCIAVYDVGTTVALYKHCFPAKLNYESGCVVKSSSQIMNATSADNRFYDFLRKNVKIPEGMTSLLIHSCVSDLCTNSTLHELKTKESTSGFENCSTVLNDGGSSVTTIIVAVVGSLVLVVIIAIVVVFRRQIIEKCQGSGQ